MFRMPHEANIDTNIANGTQPNQNFEKIFHKNKNPNPVFENPQFLKS